MDPRMHFTFSDTIAGSVVAYQADEDTFTLRTIDGREFEVAITQPDVRRGHPQPRRGLHRRDRPDARDARPRAHPLRLRDLLPRGRRAPSSRPSASSSSAARAQDFVFERPEWWVQQVREIADFYRNAQWPDGNIDFSVYRTQITPRGRQAAGHAAGDGHDLAPGLRLRDRVPDDRRGPLPRGGREGHRVPARPHAHGRRGRGHRLLGARRSTPPAARRRRSSPPSSATTTTRSRPTSRSTRSPARRRRSASRATRGSRATSS